ncbi:MAG: carbonic anhydrase family protein [Magnetococcales bacterium]|nr:carbonic anhydrase family protein [Magnetococcales bacterium]
MNLRYLAAAALVVLPLSLAQAAGGKAPWTHEGARGPSFWGGLGYETCDTGRMQSPVDLNPMTPHASGGITFNYKNSNVNVINNGHTVQFDYDAGSSITVNGKTFDLLQFHFHSHSEHTVKGQAYPVELHLVHKSKDGELAVVGVFIEANSGTKSDANYTTDVVFSAMPSMTGVRLTGKMQINAADLLPHDKAYFTYKGSLTTPPCSEGVNWFVMRAPVTANKRQMARYMSIYPSNARPVQPWNNRAAAAAASGHAGH